MAWIQHVTVLYLLLATLQNIQLIIIKCSEKHTNPPPPPPPNQSIHLNTRNKMTKKITSCHQTSEEIWAQYDWSVWIWKAPEQVYITNQYKLLFIIKLLSVEYK